MARRYRKTIPLDPVFSAKARRFFNERMKANNSELIERLTTEKKKASLGTSSAARNRHDLLLDTIEHLRSLQAEVLMDDMEGA